MIGAVLALVSPLLPQGELERAEVEVPASFRSLDQAQQEIIRDRLVRRVRSDPDPTVRRIVAMTRGLESYPLAEPRPFHDPEIWAKGVAPRRRTVSEGTTRHDRVRDQIPAITILPDLHKAVFYDWGRARVVRRGSPLSPEESIANLLAGYPPGADEALAGILAILDRNPDQRPIAAYVEHLYADLSARVYQGITIYEAWYSQQTMDVPDVDAIPFARQILRTNAYRSPIPKGPRRTQLYQQISQAAFEHRLYRTLREVAAAAFLSAEPRMDPVYGQLASRFHYLYATLDFEPQKLAEHMAQVGDRETLLEQADQVVETNPKAWEAREAMKQNLVNMREKLHRMVVRILEAG